MPDRQERLTTSGHRDAGPRGAGPGETGPGDVDPPTPDLAILVVEASRVVADRLTAELRAAGFEVRPAHGYVLRALRDGPQTLTRLAELLDVTKQAVGPVVDEMVALGLVAREPDPADRRAKRLRLTPRGRRARERAQAVSAAMEEEIGPRAAAALRRGLLALLERHGDTEGVRRRRARPVW